MIRDQREMLGTIPHKTKEDVVLAWYSYINHPAFSGFVTGRPGRDLIESEEVIYAYVSAGRWVADCPTPLCNGGLACWPEHSKACCLDCGIVYSVKFPAKKQIAEADSILSQRLEENRNWRPDQGEKVRMLVAENISAQLPVVVPPEEIV